MKTPVTRLSHRTFVNSPHPKSAQLHATFRPSDERGSNVRVAAALSDSITVLKEAVRLQSPRRENIIRITGHNLLNIAHMDVLKNEPP